jgi:hypothetical protein
VISTVLDLLKPKLTQAHLQIVSSKGEEPLIPLKFNPTEYQLQKQNTYAEIPIPGLETPPIQFIRGASEKLNVEVLVDTSDTLDNVNEKYIDRLRKLMDLDEHLHAPPIVIFKWDTQIFKGVLESLNTTYTMFTPEGVPLRAKLALGLKEYRPVEVQVRESKTSSPDFEKSYVVRRGDTLSSIAGAVYRDPGLWRAIAVANQIVDPRRLNPGARLVIPRLR